MIHTIANSELMSYADAFSFLQDNFDTLPAEVEYWLDRTGLVYYDVEGNVHSGDHRVDYYVDRKSIETCDFAKDHPYWQRILFSEIKGNIIPQMTATGIIKDNIPEIYAVGHKYTISHLLSKLRGFKNNVPNKHGDLFIMNSPAAQILSLYYEENEVNNLNTLNPEYLYMDFETLMNRPKWKGLKMEDWVLLFLIKMNDEQRLKAVGKDRYVPCAMDAPEAFTTNPYGKFFKRDSPTGHYGYDAQGLIGSKQSLFQLSEIMDIEQSKFPATGGEFEKKESPKNLTQKVVEQLFEAELNKINKGPQPKPHNKKQMAQRILDADKGSANLIQNHATRHFFKRVVG